MRKREMSMTFYKIGSYYNREPTGTVYSSYQIGLNKAALIFMKLTESCFVLLGYDEETETIGIKLLKKPEAGARRLCIAQGHGAITAKGFFEYFNIKVKNTKRATLVKEKEFYCFSIKQQ